MRFRLDSVRLLDDIKGSLVDGITLNVASDDLNPQLGGFINELIGKASEHDTLGALSFNIFSPRYNRKVTMRSAKKIPLTRHTVQELRDMDIEFEVNRHHS